MKERYNAFVGRFAPIHLGHQMTIDEMISRFGVGNCLIMVGSSNSYSERTPYTYAERKRMIKTIYPELEVIPLKDIKPRMTHFDGTTNATWLKNIEELEKKTGRTFIFWGGSKRDLDVPSQKFEAHILVDRDNNGLGISATLVREALEKGDRKYLEIALDPKILKLAIIGYNTYRGTRN